MDLIDISQSQEIYTVSRLTREARILLEDNFLLLWVEGEISNFVAPQSGHWYFSIKDSNAQVRAAMFRPQNRRLNFTPKDGMQVIAKVRVSLYEGRGDFQLIIEHMEEAGVGKLQKQFEALKKKLHAAGLFDPIHKKPLPIFPKHIGVITSPTGAAIRDILSVLKRRFPCVPVTIYATLVQGEFAAENIVKEIERANLRGESDVLILARGGGSIEDLWAFNEEIVAHAIFNSVLPIISGVGHEIDFTIADFVADVRAPTPSAAAELITPDCRELNGYLENQKLQLIRCMKNILSHQAQTLSYAQKHLQQLHPQRKLQEQQQRLDFLSLSLKKLIEKKLTARQQALGRLSGILDALSPLRTLQRGFAIATDEHQVILRETTQVRVGDKVRLQLMKGVLGCVIENIEDKSVNR